MAANGADAHEGPDSASSTTQSAPNSEELAMEADPVANQQAEHHIARNQARGRPCGPPRPSPVLSTQRWRWIRPLLAHPPQHRRRWLLGIRRQGWRGAAAAHVMCQVIPRRPVHRLHRGARAYSHRVRGSVVAGGASSDDNVLSSLSHTVHVHAD